MDILVITVHRHVGIVRTMKLVISLLDYVLMAARLVGKGSIVKQVGDTYTQHSNPRAGCCLEDTF